MTAPSRASSSPAGRVLATAARALRCRFAASDERLGSRRSFSEADRSARLDVNGDRSWKRPGRLRVGTETADLEGNLCLQLAEHFDQVAFQRLAAILFVPLLGSQAHRTDPD
jgi:hypothetical protein